VASERNQYKKTGLAFSQDKVRELGGNPIFYVDSRRKDLLTALDDSLSNNLNSFIPMMHLIETFGPPVIEGAAINSDFRWEREWRKKDDLNFLFSDVAFGICPEEQIATYENLANNEIVFIDPDWDEDKLKEYLSQKAKHLLEHF